MFKNDVEILDFLEQIRENGIQIWNDNGKLRYRARNNSLELGILDILRESKRQILDFFDMIAENAVPLTSIQAAYIVGQKTGCELGNTNAHYYIEYRIVELDIKRLEQAINLVIAKNDALRMVVTHEGKASFLENVPFYSVPVDYVCQEQDREQKRQQRSHFKYNYYKWPMFHFCVGEFTDKISILYVDFDCVILDAWSAKLMLDEIFGLYCGKNISFPEFSFKKYMKLKGCETNQKAEEYWKVKIQNLPSYPKLDFQKKFIEVQNIRFERIEYAFSLEETQLLYKKAKNYHFTPAAVISTIFMETLAQYSEVPEVAVNVTLFNRQPLHKDINWVLGEFTNTAIISYQKRRDSILDTIRATQDQMWELVRYREYDGANILKMLSLGEPGKAVMPVVFTCMLEGDNFLKTKWEYPFKEEFAISQTPQVILDHHVRDDLGYLKISWDYIVEIFDKRFITMIFNTYVNKIEKFIEKK